MKTKNVVDIPAAALEWSLDEVPITPRLRNALQNHGWRNLSNLHGQTPKQLLKIKGCGVGSVADLKRFLTRLYSGEFDRFGTTSFKDAPGVVVQVMDGFCSNLSPRERDIFLTRMGGYREPMTLADIGDKYGITRERVRQVVNVRIEELRRHGGPPFSRLLRDMKDQCEAAVCPLTPELLAKWVGTKPISYRYSPGYYVRAIKEIMPEFPAWAEARGAGHPSDSQRKITTEVKRLLQGA